LKFGFFNYPIYLIKSDSNLNKSAKILVFYKNINLVKFDGGQQQEIKKKKKFDDF
jgi:hypothetical protein